MSIWQAIVLAIIEGITEFLPISSTGHMIIGSALMGIETLPFVKVYTVAIQFGAILSVVALYWKRFFKGIDFYIKLAIGFLPAVVFGLLLKDVIDAMLENIVVVAVALIVGGVLFLFLDNYFTRRQAVQTSVETDVTPSKALRIGMFQVLAMVPGVSRSAATIIGGLVQGLSPTTAAEFSFFLAVPTMFAATAKSLYDYTKDGGIALTGHELILLAVGNVIAFVVAFLAIRSFIRYLTQHGFKVFGYYRIAVGLLILALWATGWFSNVELSNF
jgi:undecaprenyl-diphosphatase